MEEKTHTLCVAVPLDRAQKHTHITSVQQKVCFYRWIMDMVILGALEEGL